MRRPLLAAVVGCAVGGGLVLLAAGRQWGSLDVSAAGHVRQHVSVTGNAVASGLGASGIALLALAVAALAGSGTIRRIAGAITVLVGAAAVAASIHGHERVHQALRDKLFGATAAGGRFGDGVWWVVAIVGAVIAVVAGAAVVARGGSWATMGARYDAPGAERPPRDEHSDVWAALDRGEDPTDRPPPG